MLRLRGVDAAAIQADHQGEAAQPSLIDQIDNDGVAHASTYRNGWRSELQATTTCARSSHVVIRQLRRQGARDLAA
jgi:hypothetical protein